jgi:hypothetical protein
MIRVGDQVDVGEKFLGTLLGDARMDLVYFVESCGRRVNRTIHQLATLTVM